MDVPLPRNEARRLEELRRHEILDTAPEPTFDRIVGLAARFFAMPYAAVTFVDEFRVWSKASHGLDWGEGPRETARDVSICSYAILRQNVFVIRDVQGDERFCHNPFAKKGDLRFYAAAPLRTAEGCALGALCIMDSVRREFTAEDEQSLADMAAIVMDEMTLRRCNRDLREEARSRYRAQRVASRQHNLLQRLAEAQEASIRRRTAELTRENEKLHTSIAQYERIDSDLSKARDEAGAANRAKGEFLSRMSHELRTPLNAILGFGQILQDGVSAQDQVDCTRQIVTAGRHMLSLVNEVLDLGKIEEGRSKLAVERILVANLVEESLDLTRAIAVKRKVSLEVARRARPGQEMMADRRRFKQVLLNLLSNAMKYGPEGGRVTVSWKAMGERQLRVSVTDRGPGISRESAGKLFTPFERLGAETSDVPGTGLGLALSKRLVELMGGKVGVRSSPGRGSVFWVQFPMSNQVSIPVPSLGGERSPLHRLPVPPAVPTLPPVITPLGG